MKKILALLCFLPMLALAQAPPLYVRATNGIPYSGNSGVVTVFRTDGTFTNFFGSTDVERGTALKRALSIPAEGYTVYLGSGVFDCGLASLALSNGVSVIGSGRANTIIKEAAFSVNNYHTLQGFTLTNNNGAFIAQKFNGAATYYVGLSVIDVTANAGAAVDNIVLSKYHTNVWFNNVSLRSSGDVVVIPLGSISRWDNCILEGKTSAYQDAVAAMADDRFVLQVFNNVLFSVNATVNNSTVHRATTTNIYNACNFEIKGSGNNFGVIEAVAGANLQFNSCLLTNRATGGTPLDFLVPAGANVYVNAGTVYDRSRVSGTVLPMQGNGEKLWGDDEAYGAGWSDDLTLPTKKRLYAKIETIAGGDGISFPLVQDTMIATNMDFPLVTASLIIRTNYLDDQQVGLEFNGVDGRQTSLGFGYNELNGAFIFGGNNSRFLFSTPAEIWGMQYIYAAGGVDTATVAIDVPSRQLRNASGAIADFSGTDFSAVTGTRLATDDFISGGVTLAMIDDDGKLQRYDGGTITSIDSITSIGTITSIDSIGTITSIDSIDSMGTIGYSPSIARTVWNKTSNTGNSGTTETTLQSFELDIAKDLTINNQKLVSHWSVNTVGSGTATRRIKIYCGSAGDNTDEVLYDSGAVTLATSGLLVFETVIHRISASSYRATTTLNTPAASSYPYTSYLEGTPDFDGTTIVHISGEADGVGAASDDIVVVQGYGEVKP